MKDVIIACDFKNAETTLAFLDNTSNMKNRSSKSEWNSFISKALLVAKEIKAWTNFS